MKTARRKGCNFERVLAQDLRDAFGWAKKQCYRTPMSGGHYAQRTQADLTLSADVHERFPWVLEAKHWQSFHAGKFFQLNQVQTGCLIQAEATALRAIADPEVRGVAYRPLLVVKANLQLPYAVIPSKHATNTVKNTPHIFFEAPTTHYKRWYAILWADFVAYAVAGQV